jgi:hypothetical protein
MIVYSATVTRQGYGERRILDERILMAVLGVWTT